MFRAIKWVWSRGWKVYPMAPTGKERSLERESPCTSAVWGLGWGWEWWTRYPGGPLSAGCLVEASAQSRGRLPLGTARCGTQPGDKILGLRSPEGGGRCVVWMLVEWVTCPHRTLNCSCDGKSTHTNQPQIRISHLFLKVLSDLLAL